MVRDIQVGHMPVREEGVPVDTYRGPQEKAIHKTNWKLKPDNLYVPPEFAVNI